MWDWLEAFLNALSQDPANISRIISACIVQVVSLSGIPKAKGRGKYAGLSVLVGLKILCTPFSKLLIPFGGIQVFLGWIVPAAHGLFDGKKEVIRLFCNQSVKAKKRAMISQL